MNRQKYGEAARALYSENIFRPLELFSEIPHRRKGFWLRSTAVDLPKILSNGWGFTLIELLVVLAITSILITLSMSLFSSVVQSHGLSQEADDTAGLLEFARDEAMARQTYTWVGFQPLTNSSGIAQIQIAAVASLDGTGTNTTPGNLSVLSKTLRLGSAVLSSWGELKPATQSYATNIFLSPSITPSSIATNTTGINFQVGSTSFTRNDSITFTPRGEALLAGSVSSTNGYNSYIDVSFRQTHGTTLLPNADDVSVVVDGATGAVQVVRLQ